MVNKIEKFFKKMSKEEKLTTKLIIQQAYIDYKKIPNLKKLSGKKDLFRIRIGRFRLILKVNSQEVKIIRLTKRDNNTYKKL